MGCDIHLIVEKRDGAGNWHTYKTLKHGETAGTYRNYARFGALAGVRGIGPKPKGLPSDISDSTAFIISDYGEGHSMSWMPLKEALELFRKTEPVFTEKSRIFDEYDYFQVCVEVDELDNWDDYRIVFFFDN